MKELNKMLPKSLMDYVNEKNILNSLVRPEEQTTSSLDKSKEQ